MEQKERMLLEIVVAAVFVIFLVALSIIVVNAFEGSSVEVKNSYNTYNINVNQQTDRNLANVKPYIVDAGTFEKVYYLSSDGKYLRDSDRNLMYSDFAETNSYRGIFDNRVDDYRVYVRNRDDVGGYFKVTYYFDDYYGETQSGINTKYIPAGKEATFSVKDVSPRDFKYGSWHYKVESMTKSKTQIYYNTNGEYIGFYN